MMSVSWTLPLFRHRVNEKMTKTLSGNVNIIALPIQFVLYASKHTQTFQFTNLLCYYCPYLSHLCDGTLILPQYDNLVTFPYCLLLVEMNNHICHIGQYFPSFAALWFALAEHLSWS